MQRTSKQTKKPESPFWTARQCADYANCSTGTIWNLERGGKLPSYRLNRVVRFKREDLDKLLGDAREAR